MVKNHFFVYRNEFQIVEKPHYCLFSSASSLLDSFLICELSIFMAFVKFMIPPRGRKERYRQSPLCSTLPIFWLNGLLGL